jgi:hypothetical protein
VKGFGRVDVNLLEEVIQVSDEDDCFVVSTKNGENIKLF